MTLRHTAQRRTAIETYKKKKKSETSIFRGEMVIESKASIRTESRLTEIEGYPYEISLSRIRYLKKPVFGN